MSSYRKRIPLRILTVLWLAISVVGLLLLARYKVTPGRAGETPVQLADVPETPLSPGQPRLLLFAHPHCPCTAASLTELTEALAQRPQDLAVEVVVVQPGGDDWTPSSLAVQASRIPGVRVRADAGGKEAWTLGVQTSGHVLLYDASGRLLFSGGITRARGHAGNNTGRRLLRARVQGEAATLAITPVYGCPLFASCPSCAEANEACPQ